MQTMQQEIKRLSQNQADLLHKFRDQQALVSVMESSTPTMQEYLVYAVRKEDIDSSALLPPMVDSPIMTLSEHLLALEDVTRRLQDEEAASRPLMDKIAHLESSVWLHEERINGATGQMDCLEEYTHTRWQETQQELELRQRDLGSIRGDHERLEAEVREAVKRLENKWEATPAALQESLTRSIKQLTGRIETVELSLHDIAKSVTAISELNLRLSARQTSLESLIIQFLGNKERKDTGINTDRSVLPDLAQQAQVSQSPAVILPNPVPTHRNSPNHTQKIQQAQASQSPAAILLAPNPVLPTRGSSPGPYIGGHRKSPRLQKLEAPLETPPAQSKSSTL
jgi:DNA repair exonuclease SbcCD ATPase subunit